MNEPDLDEILKSIEASIPTDTTGHLTEEEAKSLQAEVDEQSRQLIEKIQANTATLDAETLKFLVVDDSNTIRRRLQQFFSKYKIHVEHADSGNKTLDIVEQIKDFDIITMDVNMPGMSGLDTMKLIKEKGINTPVIMVTTESEKDVITQALLNGAAQYIVKPFSEETVMEKVSQVLQKFDKKLIPATK